MGGFAHIGFIECLSERKLLENVDTWVGCSIGSLVALMSVIGMSPTEIFKRCLVLDGSIFNFKNISRLWAGFNLDGAAARPDQFGLDDGEYFFAFMVDILVQNGFDPGVTFAELEKQTGKRLIVLATNLTTAQEIYMSPATTPREKVLRAVRMSVGIPFLLTPVVLENGDCVVDGGVTENYPLEYAMHDFLSRKPRLDAFSAVLGCNLEAHPPKQILTLEEYLAALIFCSLRKPGAVTRFSANTVRVFLNFEDTFDFSASDAVRTRLRATGYDEAYKFLAKHPRWNSCFVKLGPKVKLD